MHVANIVTAKNSIGSNLPIAVFNSRCATTT